MNRTISKSTQAGQPGKTIPYLRNVVNNYVTCNECNNNNNN